MEINRKLADMGMSKYMLSKKSGVAKTTIMDICSGKARIEKCSADTLYRIAKVLGVTMESLIEEKMNETPEPVYRPDFEVFKSNVCHAVKDKGDLDFLVDVLENGRIDDMYKRGWYPEALYLLAMVDYLSRENDIPLCTKYDDMRSMRLEKTIYPRSLLILVRTLKDDRYLEQAVNTAIPEFLRHNIVENEVRNVV